MWQYLRLLFRPIISPGGAAKTAGRSDADKGLKTAFLLYHLITPAQSTKAK
jgi:hypothetical protein